jgi:hypothetical protein
MEGLKNLSINYHLDGSYFLLGYFTHQVYSDVFIKFKVDFIFIYKNFLLIPTFNIRYRTIIRFYPKKPAR